MAPGHDFRRTVATRLTRIAVLGAFFAFGSGEASAQVEVREATIAELQAAMAEGRTTAVEILEAHLERIQAYDNAGPRLNAIIRLNPSAREQAAALDRERIERGPRGPLHGIPVLLKDNYDFVGMPTTAGTLAMAGVTPSLDAYQVERLIEAGAVIVGKTNMHELASGITTIGSLGGQTLNPYDPTRNPGGSSGGTGAAVAASFAVLAWGSDTCGSIRIPSSHNDLVGLRPTKGLSSIAGIVPLSHTQDVGGPLARTVRDLAIGLDATIGFDPRDPATELMRDRTLPGFEEALDEDALEGARIGVLETYFGEAAEDRAAAQLVRAAIERMEELGATAEEFEIPGLDSLLSGASLIQHEFKWDLEEYLASTSDPAVDSLGDILASGLLHQALLGNMTRRNGSESPNSEAWAEAFSRRAPLKEAVEAALDAQQLDAFVFPTMRREPALIGEPQRGSACQLSATSGLPSLSLPVGFTGGGLPIGMEMIGRELDDARLVSLAYAFEQATEHRSAPLRTPSLVAGRAPSPVRIPVLAEGSGWDSAVETPALVTGLLTYDQVAQSLGFDLRVEGVPAEEVHAVVLRHTTPDGERVVVSRLVRPEHRSEQGDISLTPALDDALRSGRLSLELFTRAHPLGAARMLIPALGGTVR